MGIPRQFNSTFRYIFAIPFKVKKIYKDRVCCGHKVFVKCVAVITFKRQGADPCLQNVFTEQGPSQSSTLPAAGGEDTVSGHFDLKESTE